MLFKSQHYPVWHFSVKAGNLWNQLARSLEVLANRAPSDEEGQGEEATVRPDVSPAMPAFAQYPVEFRFAVQLVLADEGILSDDILDPGGLTKYGISQAAYPSLNIADLTLVQAIEIYYRDYWLAASLDKIESPAISAELLDSIVNCGQSAGVKMLQRGLNKIRDGQPLDDDGVMGPATLKATNETAKRYALSIVAVINGEQYMHCAGLLARDPARFKRFIRGWVKRTVVKRDLWNYLP